jgi:hypothetical protein
MNVSRIKLATIPGAEFSAILLGRLRITNFPTDAVVVRARTLSESPLCFELIIQSEEFPEVPAGWILERFWPEVEEPPNAQAGSWRDRPPLF